MNAIFRPYLSQFILVFFYDILIYSPDSERHLTHIRKAFESLVAQQFVVKPTKCIFGKTEAGYLGHIIIIEG